MNKRRIQIELLLFFLLSLLWACVGFGADRNANWKLFRLPDSASATVSFSPRGKVLLKSGETGAIHWMDGFQSGQFPNAEANGFRVYESRSGQLWTLYSEGLKLYDRGRWLNFPVPEIWSELRSNPLWQIKQIPLVPAELNRVFFLLPDKLYEFERDKQITLLKSASETGLSRFIDMQESASGDLWISGINGLAKIPGPTRRLTPESRWEEFQFVHDHSLAFQRPFERNGVVTLAGIPVEQSGPRFLVQLKDAAWNSIRVDNEKIRNAWQGWDDQVWALAFTYLMRGDPHRDPKLTREATTSIGTQYDVAVEPSGAFWVATSEGLVRYASPLWRALDGFENFESPVHGFAADREQPAVNWFITTEGLVKSDGQKSKTYSWPEEFNPALQTVDAIYPMEDGKMVISAGYQPMVFDREKESFQFLVAGTNRFRILGQTSKGELITRPIVQDPRTNIVSLFNGSTHYALFNIPEEWTGTEINCGYATAGGDFWLGSNHGLAVQREPSGKPELVGPEERFFVITEGPGGKLWAGGVDKVWELQGKNWISILSGVDRVNAITRDDEGNYWVGCVSGLYRFMDGSWIQHSVDEGLNSTIVYEIKPDSKGRLIACTSRGARVLHPESDPDPPRTLEPSISYPATPSTLEPTTISFEAIDKWDYTSAKQLLFSSKLDEGPWTVFTNVSSRIFEKLSSGKHRIEVRAMDKNGNKDSDSTFLEFVVIVPWFQDPRLLAVSILAAILTLCLGAFAFNRHLQLKQSYAAVEKIVAQRTLELEKANQELLMTEKMRAIGTMSAGIAHDFNNILSIIKGSAQIIESNVEDQDKIKIRVNRIKMVVEQGSNIVKAMLGIGRMDDKNLAPCDIALILEDVVRLVSDRYPETVRFQVESDLSDSHLLCSREVLNQMLLNLLLNAADAVGQQGNVTVGAAKLDALPEGMFLEPGGEGPWVEISISDDGVGITSEILPRIFEPFFTTKALSSKRGTGLGLSMVYELAKGMQYGLKVESEAQLGSRFSIFLPLKKEIVSATTRQIKEATL